MSGELLQGEIAPLDIRSEQGQPCTVENPWPTSQVQVWRDGQLAEKVTGERFDLLTRPGEQLRLAPCTGAGCVINDTPRVSYPPRACVPGKPVRG